MPPGEDLQEISSGSDEDAFRVVRSQRPMEGERSSDTGGRREPRTKVLHDRSASAGRDAPHREAAAPLEEAGAGTLQPPTGKKRVWRATDE